MKKASVFAILVYTMNVMSSPMCQIMTLATRFWLPKKRLNAKFSYSSIALFKLSIDYI